MTLKEFKQAIIDNTLSDSFVILVCQENHFIAHQYIHEIATKTGKQLNFIDSIYDVMSSNNLDALLNIDDKLNIIYTDEFNEPFDNYSLLTNTIVICDVVNKKIAEQTAGYQIKIEKLTDWQILAYVQQHIPNISEQDFKQLYTVTAGDIYRIDNEVTRLLCFDINERANLLHNYLYNTESDLCSMPVFGLVDALKSNDKFRVANCLYCRYNSDFEPLGIVTMLLNDFKKIALIKYSDNIDYISAGCKSQNQFNYLKNNSNYYSQKQLIEIINCLSEIDNRIRTGQLELTRDQQLDYIICNVLR